LETTHIWDAFSMRLRNFLRGRVQNPDDAEDLLQEVFLKIHCALDSLRKARRPEAWIYRVARNAVIDFYRSKGPEAVDADEALQFFSAEEDEDNLRALVECLRPFIRDLPEKYRIVVEKSELQGMKHKEIAAELGLTVSGVKTRVQRAREMIRGNFEDCCRIKLNEAGVIVRTGEPRCGCE
ncbi:MAG: RNA polymerase sigma factor SigZ, partial [Bacteroidota bacterium]